MRTLDPHIDRFVVRLRPRLMAGVKTDLDASHVRPATELVHEVQQELEAVCARKLALWLRLERVHQRVQRAHNSGGRDGHA